jgi:RNA polymerase sigma-70 factor (ECF subfamily)
MLRHPNEYSRVVADSAGKPAALAASDARDDLADRELLRQIAGGDSRALEQLYRGYQRRLLQFLSRLTPRSEILGEAINDTFWIVWQKADEFRGASRVSTWIMGIGWRCAHKAIRRGASTVTKPFALEAEPVSEEAQAEQLQWLEHGLARLPLEQRVALELAYFMGHSCEEIAQIMSCPINTVKARMFQARMKLRGLLPRLGGLEEARARSDCP